MPRPTSSTVLPDPLTRRGNAAAGVLWMLISCAQLAGVAALGRYAAPAGVSPLQVVILRLLFGLIALSPVLAWRGPEMLRTSSLRLYAVRATVATHSAVVAATLAGSDKRSRAFLLGGEFNADDRQTVGEMTLSHIRGFRARTAVLTVGAIHATAGVMDFNIEEAQVARAMIDQAERVIVLVESSKFDRTAMFTVCDLAEIDILVCDAPPPEHLARAMRDAGIELVTA